MVGPGEGRQTDGLVSPENTHRMVEKVTPTTLPRVQCSLEVFFAFVPKANVQILKSDA